ncbi:MAG: hypothetical protein U1D69_07090 [Polynucleobacter sp.]|uniref:hypothetical protein n=1 Tax=Limnobacter sp. TaxID=2003368 RepID=UPI002733B7FA|nr:hypothetical protein [Limnobacter sp.]MDP3270783.1 hypothetical protein [Limnobacter sp.]MDZ4056721.1 hypothetical protein [Polynucleobacter sp.]
MENEETGDTKKKLITLEELEIRSIERSTAPYYRWLNHLLTLSSLQLTLLVAFGENYISGRLIHPELLALCWVCLSLAVVCGVFSTRSEYKTHLASAYELRRARNTQSEAQAARFAYKPTYPHWSHYYLSRAMLVFFLAATIALCTFAIANLYSKPQLETPATSRPYP